MLAALRIFLLGLHCALASVVGLLVGLCRPFNPDNSQLCAKIYARPALRILGLKVDVDLEQLRDHPQPCVFIANHQSNLDLFVVGGIVPKRSVSVGKKSLKWIPLFGQVYWLAGNILIDRDNARQARRAILTIGATLRDKGTSIWVFPEGTRNHGNGLLPFKKGAFQMALAAGVPIVPVCVSSYVNHMQPNRWHSGSAIIRCLPPIATAGLSSAQLPALMRACQASMAECIATLDERQAAARQHPDVSIVD